MAKKVSIIGSGNWGSAIARMVGQNCLEKPEKFQEKVDMWVFEETVTVDNKEHKLTEYINANHENVKYLPGFKLPANVVAEPDVKKAVAGAKIIVFVLPHQFVKRTCLQIKDAVEKDAIAISLCKGFEVTDKGLTIMSQVVSQELNISCGALMGANLAKEVAMDQFAEATIASKNMNDAKLLRELFERPTFRCACVTDVVAVEVCGAFKNVIGIGSGFVDALGMGNNTKCAIIRLGLMEMMAFAKQFYGCTDRNVFFESCGVADLVTTCYGGRHAKLGKLFVLKKLSFAELEKQELNGQKLQGHETAKKIYDMLVESNCVERYPLVKAIYKVAFENMPAQDIFKCLQTHPDHMD